MHTMLDAVEEPTARTDPHSAGISAHFDGRVDGTGVLNHAEWISADAGTEFAEGPVRRRALGTVGARPPKTGIGDNGTF
ncbi:hypothetical protein [Amycolatopsis granulosa]|uniref:hypothetical protein n=1 Tax=Amycolatopsis granulosa TaxID=185684 RepID=UPI00141DBC49|nr:hypothetical protein [Amycolatopsis granulosa]NIH83799.1 hypothetical protein [Amycolatopsis granulosa]